jgi:hypothetical protein
MRASILVLVCATACGDTGQPRIAAPAFARGTAPRTEVVGAWSVRLTRASVGFGPVTFCASRASSPELCPAALAEVAQATTVDALDPARQPIGTLDGFVGTVRSAGFAYGVPWFPFENAPRRTGAAPGGRAARIEGIATSTADPSRSFAFVAEIDVLPRSAGLPAVSVTGLDAPIDARTTALEVVIDPNAWLAQVDFDALAAIGTSPVTIAPDARAANAIAVGMTTLAQPTWSLLR